MNNMIFFLIAKEENIKMIDDEIGLTLMLTKKFLLNHIVVIWQLKMK